MEVRKVGDGMMSKNARILMLAAAPFVLLGSALLASASGGIPELQGLAAESGSTGPVIHLYANGDLETVHYSPQPGVWVVEMPEAAWDEGAGFLSDPHLGIERAELEQVEEFGKRVTRLTVWLEAPAQLAIVARPDGVDLQFASPDLPAATVVAPVEREEAPPAAPSEGALAPSKAAGASLVEVVPVLSGDGLVVELRGDGPLSGRSFSLPGPDRIVVDLPGVVNRVQRNRYPVGSSVVRQVRVAQYQTTPEPIARVVVDLEVPTSFSLSPSASGATLVVGAAGAPAVPEPVAVAMVEDETEGTVISNVEGPITVPRGEPMPQPVAPEPPPVVAATETAQPHPEPPARSPWVADPSQLIERAPAAQVVESPASGYESTEVSSEEQRYTGEPITLTLKDADIKDVLRTFSTLTNLNIVVDPGVGGSVTVELRNVPWDQALDLILKINDLGYTLENNVLRVARVDRLQSEKRKLAELAADQENAQPLKTVTKPISYARASEVAAILVGDNFLASPRGSVVIDQRTNTLIIRDTIERVEGMLRLIDQLDTPTPQLVIEARIVETTRDYARRLGVDWGFTGVADAEHGNDSGLVFPNNGAVFGDVNLPRAFNGILGFTFGDILDTFNLDFALMAGENEGVVKIVSTPRVTTQTLKRATIRSGLQIPVQTVANNTVTVQYVDATLNLDVLPQVTAEGTVNMELTVKKQQPVEAAAVQGGNNLPIFTRDVNTNVLVRDGGTTVLGGIYQLTDDHSESSVPGLSKIPILGFFFKNNATIQRHDELLIFITPRIVKY